MVSALGTLELSRLLLARDERTARMLYRAILPGLLLPLLALAQPAAA